MYVKTTTRQTKDGSVVRYLHLAHNEWDAEAGRSKPRIVYSFGRADQLDRAAIERLIGALCRLLGTETTPTPPDAPTDLVFTDSRSLGGTHVLDALWQRLGIGRKITDLLAGRKLDASRVERVLFALVANRALASPSKLAAVDWICDDAHIDGLDAVGEDACHRAMDELLQIEPMLAEHVYFQVSDLLNPEVGPLFFDTTEACFGLDGADAELPRDRGGRITDDPDPDNPDDVADSRGLRSWGGSKAGRDDSPQVVVGVAVTRDGIPVRVWSWPGGTPDSKLIRQVKDDMRDWSLSRIVWVAGRGFSSADNRRELMRESGGYIIGGKVRSESAEVKAALSGQDRYATVRDDLQVKEITIGSDDRSVLCYDPEQADRDAAVRAGLVAHLEAVIAGTDKLSRTERARLEGVIAGTAGLKRFLRATPDGLLRVDTKKIAADADLDGKYLLRSSDPELSPEDIALSYKQLLDVERGWHDMQPIINLRPVHHRLEDRIRAQVLLCWLALLLIRIAENAAGQTWNHIRTELQSLHAVTFTSPAGTFRQTTQLSKTQRDLLTALGVETPKTILTATPVAR